MNAEDDWCLIDKCCSTVGSKSTKFSELKHCLCFHFFMILTFDALILILTSRFSIRFLLENW